MMQQQALDRQFVDTVTPTIEPTIAMEGPSTLGSHAVLLRG